MKFLLPYHAVCHLFSEMINPKSLSWLQTWAIYTCTLRRLINYKWRICEIRHNIWFLSSTEKNFVPGSHRLQRLFIFGNFECYTFDQSDQVPMYHLYIMLLISASGFVFFVPIKVWVFDQQQNKTFFIIFQIFFIQIKAWAKLDSETKTVEVWWKSSEIHCCEVEHSDFCKPDLGYFWGGWCLKSITSLQLFAWDLQCSKDKYQPNPSPSYYLQQDSLENECLPAFWHLLCWFVVAVKCSLCCSILLKLFTN